MRNDPMWHWVFSGWWHAVIFGVVVLVLTALVTPHVKHLIDHILRVR